MNLFVLDQNPEKAAALSQDLHVRKMTPETAQLLANGFSLEQLMFAPKTQTGNVRKYSYIHHPVSKWVLQSKENFKWALKHGTALCEEFYYRFEKEHFCSTFIKWANIHNPLNVAEGPFTEHPQCFVKDYPELIVPNNPVKGYRNYYRVAKRQFLFKGKIVKASWTKRTIPDWFNN